MILLIAVSSLQTIINYGVMAWTPSYPDPAFRPLA